MQTINNRMTATQVADLFSLAVQLQVKAEESDDRDTAILAYSIQNACSNLTESRREFWAADATINNLELKITDMAVQLANAESKCRELAAECAGMKQLASEAYDEMVSHHDTDCLYSLDADGEQIDALIRLCDAQATIYDTLVMCETPATDSFLAEVQAQGVEMFADSLKVVGGHEHPYSVVANEFAAQLRKGGAA